MGQIIAYLPIIELVRFYAVSEHHWEPFPKTRVAALNDFSKRFICFHFWFPLQQRKTESCDPLAKIFIFMHHRLAPIVLSGKSPGSSTACPHPYLKSLIKTVYFYPITHHTTPCMETYI